MARSRQGEGASTWTPALALLGTCNEAAIRSLRRWENSSLNGLLRRVLGKIFNDPEIGGWGKE